MANDLPANDSRVCDLVAVWEEAKENGRDLPVEALCEATPELIPQLREVLRRLHGFLDAGAVVGERRPPDTPRYQFRQFLAAGGMGEVWRGFDQVLMREVAVKVLLQRVGASALGPRFRKEAQVVARLQHPAIVPVHDSGELPDGRPFFVMKLIQGRTLSELLKERSSPLADLTLRCLHLFEQICQAVAYAHSQPEPVLHRDLKPGNVMVGEFGEVLVMDWGIAKVLAESARRRSAPGRRRGRWDEGPVGRDSR